MFFPYCIQFFPLGGSQNALFESLVKIVYYATREKKVYFAGVKFDAREKRGKQSHE